MVLEKDEKELLSRIRSDSNTSGNGKRAEMGKNREDGGDTSIYTPREDSELIRKHIPKYVKGAVLDMGTGSGILARESAQYAETVIAADINPTAVNLCRESMPQTVSCVESDLFSSDELSGMRFDLITFNPPYLPRDNTFDDQALFGGKHGYETIIRFLADAKEHLKRDGVILLILSTLSGKDTIDSFIEENAYIFDCIDTHSFFFEKIFLYRIQKSDLCKILEKKGISNIRYLARGKRGIIYTGTYRGAKVTVKSKLPKSRAIGRIKIEADWLVRLNKGGIGPRFLFSGDGYVVYEFVEGRFFEEFLECANRKEIFDVIRQIFGQLRQLDAMGVDKEEMHRPIRNLLVGEKPVLIDFERAHFTERPKNVTQFCQYLVSGRAGHLLGSKGIFFNAERVIRCAQDYKNGYSTDAYRSLLSEVIKK